MIVDRWKIAKRERSHVSFTQFSLKATIIQDQNQKIDIGIFIELAQIPPVLCAPVCVGVAWCV